MLSLMKFEMSSPPPLLQGPRSLLFNPVLIGLGSDERSIGGFYFRIGPLLRLKISMERDNQGN